MLAQQVLWWTLLRDGCRPPDQLIGRERAQRGKVGQQVVHLSIVGLALQDALPRCLQNTLRSRLPSYTLMVETAVRDLHEYK